MTKIVKLFAVGIFSLAVLLAPALITEAAATGYLKIGDIKGESTDRAHKDWIIIQSASAVEPAPGGRASSSRHNEPIVVTKTVDKASPKLQEAAASGKVFSKATIHVVKSQGGRETYLKYKLENVKITSYSTGGGAAGDVPTESFSLNYSKINVSWDENTEKARKKDKRKEHSP